MGTEFPFGKMESSGDDGGDVCTTMNVLNARSCALKMVNVVKFMLWVFYHNKKSHE